MRLALVRTRQGWRIAVLNEKAEDVIPPSPARGIAIPHEIDGWHFRNADNTGPNTGDVNAPQRERLFVFMLPGDVDVASGAGWLVMGDYGLADLDPGQQTRMVYLRFDACLTWPRFRWRRDRPETKIPISNCMLERRHHAPLPA